MKRILFVDDDPVVLRIYKDTLSKHGFQVEPARDVSTASKVLQGTKPDLLVLDLMMPKREGVEILNLIRSQPDLAGLPVVMLSNSYTDGLSRDGAALGPHRALLKVQCTPSILLGVIRELLELPAGLSNPPVAGALTEALPEIKTPPATSGQKPVPAAAASPASASPRQEEVEPKATVSDVEFRVKARQHFLQNSAATCAELHRAFRAFTRAQDDVEREVQLQNLYRKVHFLAAGAGLAECTPIALMASVFEALLFEITNKPALQAPSMRRTIAQAVDFFDALFQHAAATSDTAPASEILVVDDDALSNRVVVSALRHAQLHAVSTEDPLVGLQWLGEKKYDLVLMDIEMPGMNGFELCKRLRQLPGYRKTPVIYVTSHSDFESRAKSALSGGDDLIAKPVFPMELAVKAMTHLLSNQLPAKSK